MDDVLLLKNSNSPCFEAQTDSQEKRRFWVQPAAANREQQGDYGNLNLELRADQVVYGSAWKAYRKILEPVAKQGLRMSWS